MAEENGSPPVIPERIKREAVSLRRKLAGPSSPTSPSPNYLRASTGSCHDFCKFGKPHSSEPKARNFLRKKLVKRPPEDEILIKSAVFPDRKKNPPVNRPRSSPGSQQVPVLEAPDVSKQKGLNFDRRNVVRADLVEEKKKATPAARIKPSLTSRSLSLNARKPVKKDLFSTSETSKQALPTNGTSKQVQQTNETLKQALLSEPKERRLSGSPIAPVRSNSLPLRRLSSSDSSSLLRLQKIGEVKPRESIGIAKRVVAKNNSVPSSASRLSKSSMSKRITTNVPRMIVGQRITLNGASPRKSKDKVKDVEAARVSIKEAATEETLLDVDAEEILNLEETESKTSEPVTIESVDEAIVNVEEMQGQPLEAALSEDIAESIIVNEEETEGKPFEAASSEGIAESILMNVEETHTEPFEVASGESIVEKDTVNVEETETEPFGVASGEGIVESDVVNVEETETEPFGVASGEGIVESDVVNVEETETEPFGVASGEAIVNVELTESEGLEAVASEGIVESDILDVKETESEPLEPICDESSSPPLPISVAESSLLSPTDSSPTSPQEEDQTESEYTMSELDYSGSEFEESDLLQGGEVSEEGDGKTQAVKGGSQHPEPEEGHEPRKLHFRRGRVIDVQLENDTPRRLRFRRRRQLSEDQNPEHRRSSLKRREQSEGENGDGATGEGSAKVVLRHSDMQEKKDAKGLFNNVIEETASKLAETRKSKVKALVGAFETVISLQDTKPSANT